MTIYKYPLCIADTQEIFMPANAKILSAQVQGGTICLWAMVQTRDNINNDHRTIEVFGTGWEFALAERTFIGTVQSGLFVWHVFERL